MPTQNDTDQIIRAFAERQWGVVSRAQLLDARLTSAMIGERVRAGRLIPLHPGVYAVGHARLRREGHWLAAVLAVGPGAALSHRDAAGLHGLRPANHRRVDVSTTGRAKSTPKIQVHRTRVLDAADVTKVSGIPVTSVARTLLDLAGHVAREHLAKAVREAERQRTFDLRKVDATMARTRGRRGRGHRALREAIQERRELGAAHTRSPLEDVFLRIVRQAGLSLPSTNALVEGFEVDAVWRRARVVVELDGWAFHNDRRAFERDRARDAALTAAGWRVVRFTHRQATRRPREVVGLLRRLGVS